MWFYGGIVLHKGGIAVSETAASGTARENPGVNVYCAGEIIYLSDFPINPRRFYLIMVMDLLPPPFTDAERNRTL